MKFYHIDDIDGFFDTVSKCKGTVELVTDEGDRLNLKSKLSRIVAFADVFSGGEIPGMEILTSDPDDMRMLMNFMMTDSEQA